VPPRRKQGRTALEKRFERDYRAQADRFGEIAHQDRLAYSGRGVDLGQRQLLVNELYPSHESVLAERKEQALRTPRKRKGLNGITGYGSKMVRSGCYLLQQTWGKDRLGFLTLTLPDNRDYLHILSMGWAELVRKFDQELTRELERKGAPTHYIQVTEVQEKRSRATGMVIPHLHLVYVAWDGKNYRDDGKRDYYLSYNWLQQTWQRVLENSLGTWKALIEGSKLDKARISIETIKKSVEGYLGKYMTKGKKALQKLIKDGFALGDIPCHWWGCNREMRAMVKEGIQPLPGDIVAAVLGGVDLVARGVARYLNRMQITLKGDGEERQKTVGYAFRLVERWNRSLRFETG
jgi:hypothetical protein